MTFHDSIIILIPRYFSIFSTHLILAYDVRHKDKREKKQIMRYSTDKRISIGTIMQNDRYEYLHNMVYNNVSVKGLQDSNITILNDSIAAGLISSLGIFEAGHGSSQ